MIEASITDIIDWKAPRNKIIKNNFGKIDLRNGPAPSSERVLKTDGATTDVWKIIIPEIKPDMNIGIESNILIYLIYVTL